MDRLKEREVGVQRRTRGHSCDVENARETKTTRGTIDDSLRCLWNINEKERRGGKK